MHNQPAAISFVWHAAYNNATDTICSSVETVFDGGDSSWFSTERRLRIHKFIEEEELEMYITLPLLLNS